MLSVHPAPIAVPTPPLSPHPEAAPAAFKDLTTGQGEGLDQWFDDLRKYEATLSSMAAASEDPKFRDELGTIEQWFMLLNNSERTATLYTLLQHANPNQVKFMSAVLSQMSDATPAPNTPKKKGSAKSVRPPSLNLPPPDSPATPRFNESEKPVPKAASPPVSPVAPAAQELLVKPSDENSWASMVNTPMDKMFQPASPAAKSSTLPMSPFNMAMLNNMSISKEAQILAVQMVMSGLVKPPQPQQHPRPPLAQRTQSKTHSNNWRAPSSAKYPGSALKSGFRSAIPRSAGLRSAALKSAGLPSGTTPKAEDDIDLEMLKDIPTWLKSLRLHKYTSCFDGMPWQDMVTLDEATLETKGVAALGARRRLLKTFELVKKKTGMEPESVDSANGPASAALPKMESLRDADDDIAVPHSAAPALNSQ